MAAPATSRVTKRAAVEAGRVPPHRGAEHLRRRHAGRRAPPPLARSSRNGRAASAEIAAAVDAADQAAAPVRAQHDGEVGAQLKGADAAAPARQRARRRQVVARPAAQQLGDLGRAVAHDQAQAARR